MDIDIKNKLKNNNPILKMIFPVLDNFPFDVIRIIPINKIKEDIFSKFNPIMKDVIVVAMLLPNIMPILLLKVSNLAFIRLIVNIITAELDCIIVVDIKPTKILFFVVDVKFNSFCFTFVKDKVIKLLLNKSIE